MKKENKNYIPNKVYKDIVAHMPVSTVDVVLLNKTRDKTLLFKRNNEPVKNVYFTIGGRLLKGESFLHGAVRQAKRELGLKIDPKKIIFAGVTQDFHKNSVFREVSYHAVAVFFAYILENENINIKFDTQHSDYRWFLVNEKKLHPHIKERIRQTLLTLKKHD
jgi:colanic acid biosynthesis protein WcaH